ncbi:hypothetical protein [Streptomyces corynorhini]|uniref:Uncharacterized protein n=1 Tax=Streptomyces corynorhini TaxID=2282652 RepID=A0A370B1I0_9ACTN|nr:hypothetical protein [Streptomyces corynorhini]RDG35688.1 hypothetical protein DVH02_23975 [Streptomyces corynorhini]
MTAWDADAPVRVVMGDCFRCDRGGLQVGRVGELLGPYGETPLYACGACTERLVTMHQQSRETPVRPYIAARADPR